MILIKNLLSMCLRLSVTFLFAVTFSFNAFAEKVSENLLGEAQKYNAFIFGNYFAEDSNSGGGIAVGGNVKLDSYSVSSMGNIASGDYALFIEGNASFDNGNVVSGRVKVEGDMSDITDSVLSSLPNGISVENEDLEYSVKSKKSFYQALAVSLSELPNNGVVANNYGGLYLSGDCESSLQVFNLDGAAVDAAHTFEVQCIPDNATIIFNISGEEIEFESKGLATLIPHRNKIIFNFYQVTDLKFSSITIEGTVLAPNAEITASDGQLMGTVIADRWDGSMSLGYVPFIGSLVIGQGAENQIPTAENLAVEGNQNATLTINVTASDPDEDTLTYTIITPVNHGELSGIAPNFIYTPATDYFGNDSFSFKVNDGKVDSTIASVSITILDVPEVDNILASAQKFNAYIFGNFFAGDSNSGGGIAVGGNLKLDSYSVASAGKILPNDYALFIEGNTSFDNGNVMAGRVKIEGDISDITDSVLSSLPDGISVENENLEYSVKAKKSFYQALAFSLSELPNNGVVANNYGGLYLSGDCESSLQVFNLDGAAVDAAHTFEVQCIPDNATIIFNISGGDIEFKSKGLATLIPHRNKIIFNFYQATDLKFSSITIEGTVLAPNAEITASDGQLMGTVIADRWDGSMSLGYVPFVGSITGIIDTENHAPTAVSESLETNEDTAASLTLAATDPDGDTLTYLIVTATSNGALTGAAPNYQYTPNENFFGTDSFTYQVNDGVADSNIATVSINVTAINDIPVVNNASIDTNEDTAVSLTLPASDPDGDALTYTLISSVITGTLSGTAPNYQYTPNENFFGIDSFTYQVNDGVADSNIATVSINVTAINDIPVVNNASIDTNEDTAVSLTLPASDPDGDALTYTLISSVINGTLSGTAPNYQYIPNENFFGSDSFTFKVNDGTVDSAVATATINIESINDKPQLTSTEVLSAQELVTYLYQLSASDPDGDTITFSLETPINGMTLSSSGQLSWLPIFGDAGSYQITVKVIDQHQASSTQDFNLVVAPRSDSSVFVEITNYNHGDTTTFQQVDIKGYVHSLLPASQLTISLGEQTATLIAADEDSYFFTFNNVYLAEGTNRLSLTVSSAVGSQFALEHELNYVPEPIIYPTIISVTSPINGGFVNEDSFILSGNIASQSPITTFTINGESSYISASNSNTYLFNYPVTFTEDTITLTLIAENESGDITSHTVNYYKDVQSPIITLTNDLAEDTVNQVFQAPYLLTGTVTDDNLSTLLINNVPVDLIPGSNTNEYAFSLSLNMEPGVESSVEVLARDLSGNLITKNFTLLSEVLAKIDIIAPTHESTFESEESTFNLQVIARVENLQTEDSVRVTIDNNTPVLAEVTNTLLNSAYILDNTAGEHNVLIEVLNSSAQVISANNHLFTLTKAANKPLTAIKTVPYNGQLHVEPHQAIELYVNKSIDPQLLSFEVRETAHGKTYINSDEPGVSFLEAKGFQLVDVSRSNELVPGGKGNIPGDNVFAFYPQRDLAYGGNITVQVMYDGSELTRFNYRVRELPTFLSGAVFDQFTQAISGIKVEIPELGRVTTTDAEGLFNFGSGDDASDTLPGGNYQLIINNDFNNPVFGVANRNVTIEKGRYTQLNKMIVPMLNKEYAFSSLESGKNHLLANGELTLDLSDGQLTFPDNSHNGLSQVSFVNIGDTDVTPTQKAFPMAVYALQPSGIKVSGNIALSLKILKLYNSYDYVPASGSYVVLVGRRDDSNTLQPIGVGQIDGYTINSVGHINLKYIDYIGYAFVEETKQPALQEYAEGQLSIQALIGKL